MAHGKKVEYKKRKNELEKRQSNGKENILIRKNNMIVKYPFHHPGEETNSYRQ